MQNKLISLFFRYSKDIFILISFYQSVSMAQQIDIPIIDSMPNKPIDYVMRDWKRVAIGYDSLVFNFRLTGNYLPLVLTNVAPVNYPEEPAFGIYTVVGPTERTGITEAINCIPAVISASLCGIDKSNQFGMNWVEMCNQWYNHANGQNVFMNGFDDRTNDDFWYETMPNVFFYELNCLYPHANDFDTEFVSIANQFLNVVKSLGGGTTPWQLPNINHQGFDFTKMMPIDVSWKEPEAAGAIAWILYNAYVVTGDEKFRIGAELSMEALNRFPSDPAYELQLAYGAYTAARMNAELGTNYDVFKMVNWLFNQSSERPWGTIAGNWGGYEVSGLVGENDYPHGYAFLMNTLEQISALVPMVRYDVRFARAIGKWVLNAANAARFFYPRFLPLKNQDSSYRWSTEYDSLSYIAHEAIHQYAPFDQTISPYASGDAISGGWGLTTLALYASSHIGILGSIVDTTNVVGILKLNLLKTDYYHRAAYPTYLFYNPYTVLQMVNIDVGEGEHDIYDAVSKRFISRDVSGKTVINIPAESAIVAVITPIGGTVTYDYEKMLINDIVVDYHNLEVVEFPPRIKSLSALSDTIAVNQNTSLYCTAIDVDGDSLSYLWSSNGGKISGTGATVNWIASDTSGVSTVTCIVSDGHNLFDTALVKINVVQGVNHSPTIESITANSRVVNIGDSLRVVCHAIDLDGDSLTYNWNASSGDFIGLGAVVTWSSPSVEGYYYVKCVVKDSHGGMTADSLGILVQDFSRPQSGNLIAYYPFDNGKVNDASGNGNDAFNYYSQPDTDRFGNPNGALFFNGTNSYVEVVNDSTLNFQDAITVCFWMKVKQLFDNREEYLLSHDKWNRWKVSISSDRLRWTIGTRDGVHDLDTEEPIIADSLYFVAVIYNGSSMEIFLNGDLDAYTSWSGNLNTSTVDLMIGAVFPGDNSASFCGTLDDIRIFDYPLLFPRLENFYLTSLRSNSGSKEPLRFELYQNFPSPFNPATKIRYELPIASNVSLVVYDILGRVVKRLVEQRQSPGIYEVTFDASGYASGVYFYRLQAGNLTMTKKMILIK
jgi:hypothetical protein